MTPSIATKITPQDHGRRMTLAEFDRCEVQPGYYYELARGVIVVSDVPNRPHFKQVHAIRRQLVAYDLAHPGKVDTILSGGECKIMAEHFESERHPDLALYLTAALDDSAEVWWSWVPDLVVEVVSPGSDERDYVEKREEYLSFGVSEYWIIDASRGEMLALSRRGGRWAERVVRPPELYSPRRLPSLNFDLAVVFAAMQ